MDVIVAVVFNVVYYVATVVGVVVGVISAIGGGVAATTLVPVVAVVHNESVFVLCAEYHILLLPNFLAVSNDI